MLQKLNNLYLQIVAIASFITATTTIIIAIRTIIKSITNRNAGIKCLLRANLISMCSVIIAQGYITINELSNLDETFEAYTQLGGNGFVKDLVEKTKATEVRQ